MGDLGGSVCVESVHWEGDVFLGGVIGTLAFLLVLRYEFFFENGTNEIRLRREDK